MMAFLTALRSAVQDDLLITLSVGIGCLIAAACLEKRSRVHMRVVISFFLAFGWMVAARWYIAGSDLYRMQLGMVRYGVFFLIFALSVNFWSKASFCQSLFAITVAYSIQNMCERLIEIPRYSLPHFPLLLDRLCLAALMAAALYVYYRVLIGNAREREMFDFSNMSSRMMLFMGVSVVAVNVVLDIKLHQYTMIGGVSLANCHNIMSAMFSFLTIVVCMSHLRETYSERRAQISAQLLYSEQRRYEQDKQIHDAINIKCHDIRHQIAALGEEGYREELKKIGKLINIYDTSLHTQNAALDVILSGKMLACSNQNITLTCLADGRRMGFMEDSDIYALFGNILDNAIEATLEVSDPEHRMISLTVGTMGDLLLIESQNFFSGELTFKEGLPETTKQDKDYHGFGTRSIRTLTEKYGGDLKLQADGGIFRLSIMLPIPA